MSNVGATFWDKHVVKDWSEFVAQIEKFRSPRPSTQSDTGEVNRLLFRGCSNACHNLKPSLARLDLRNRPYLPSAFETWLLDEFKRHARLHAGQINMPPEDGDDRVRWWELMQHYGAPTRLLDWTASPYVAAYFACGKSTNRDGKEANGAVWVVDHGAITDRSRSVYPEHFSPDRVQHLPLDTDAPDQEHLRAAIAFTPAQQLTDRMAAQRGWFSVCSLPGLDHAEAIDELLKREKRYDTEMMRRRWTRKLVIPAQLKPIFLRKLWDMNINELTLFPGLDGLGRQLSRLHELLTPEREHGQSLVFHWEQGIISQHRGESADTSRTV